MPHNITAIILPGHYDKSKAEIFDLFGKQLPFNLTLFHIDHYQTACWQYELKATGQLEISFSNNVIFPNDIAIAEIMKQITGHDKPLFALIQTDYFGGIGSQYAGIFRYTENIDTKAITINQVLVHLGVKRNDKFDEFDTIGLDKIRNQPDYFEKYIDLADRYGI